MVLIPAGEFQMGSNDSEAQNDEKPVHTYRLRRLKNPMTNSEAQNDEKPVHTVYLDAFYMDVYEVTNAQYKKFVDANPGWGKGRIPRNYHNGDYLKQWNRNSYPNSYPSGKGNHPVEYVSWYGAMAYSKWAGKRLPTEAEWEKAARGGLVGKTYPWGDSIDSSKANYGGNVGGTTAVGSYPPNGYGLYDMGGNVWEWCLDAYDANFYSKSPRRNPIAGAGSIVQVTDNFTNVKNSRVLRGGAWDFNPEYLRAANHVRNNPAVTNDVSGFRCVRTLTP